ncbi:protein spinster homolog 3 [Hypomesus transpacificus]|uniref:protein spinster homolog 3 n=1 Tax=Hypomesus transpacificus TaxID=137520 RepID=UPI001F086E46|nr:protein spinster homolog 3 [Hypomesus transpacificus]XP_046876583.1 protein spinster homolog 3 [Hypomesus transpacificus]XP_046876584.1 protein spinster homolog 3 [Hypomesus transpacificus]
METTGPVMSRQDGKTTCLSLRSTSGPRYGSISDPPLTEAPPAESRVISPKRSYIAVAVLCYVNLINYIDRYTIAGVLLNIQKFFEISDSTSGLLQTVFIFSFIFLAPIFGYLGDRYNRKFIMIGALTVWLMTALGSSFVSESKFWLLVFLRALVGTGEAGYSTIAPTIIGDLFSGTKRTLMISAFYIFIPVGSGLGYIIGSSVTSATGDWRWALRLVPILGSLGLVLLVVLCPNPPRGGADTHRESLAAHSPYMEDIKYLLKNKSYVWSSLGVTAMAFLTGALAFWTPTFLSRAQVSQGIRPPCTTEPCDPSDSYIFGAVTVVTGILGVTLGSTLSRKLRDKVPNIDPLICAVGMLSSAPCLFTAIILASTSIPATYVFIGIGGTLISLNWPILADILLYVVVPTKRATAEALQIVVLHLLGDAGSPYLIGVISDTLSTYEPASDAWSFRSLEYSLLLCPFMGVVGGLFFLMTALYITQDRKDAQLLTSGQPPPDALNTRIHSTLELEGQSEVCG